MNKKNRRKNKRKIQPDRENNYERYDYGDLTLERFGRYTSLTSNRSSEDHKAHIKKVKASQPVLKAEISKKIQELIQIAKEYNPLELLSAITPENLFTDIENFKESTHKGKESYIEYAQSIILSVEIPNTENHATKEAIDKFRSLIDEIFNDTIWYFSIDSLNYESAKAEIRYKSLLHYLMLRGDSYPQHHLELVKDLFQPHDEFFTNNYGFTTDQFISYTQSIENETLESLKRYGQLSENMHELHELYVKFVNNNENSFSNMQEIMQAFDLLPEVQLKKIEVQESFEKIDDIVFEVKPSNKIPKSFLDLLSSKFGENRDFALFEKSPGWISNNTIIYRKPIISHDNKYYCFGIQFLYRNLITILESLIREKDNKYFEQRYQKTRGKYLVNKSLEYLSNLLPNAKIYKELFYEIDGKRAETDGIIIFDSSIFIIEGKAGSLTIPARRGALARIEYDVTQLVDDAYKQALRTKRFIDNSKTLRFEYEDGTEALVINDKDFLKNTYLINLTIENLGHLSINLNNLKKLNLIQGTEWIWSVFLNDLRVISEIIEIPSEFLTYLQRRLKANNHPQFQSSDELDFLMYYFNEGLYFENNWLKKYSLFVPHAYTEELDRYYNFQLGLVSSGEKPHLKIPEDYKRLIKEIESTQKPSFSDVTTNLLSFSIDSMEEILKNIERAKNLSLNDERDHDFTLTFSSLDLGLTVAIISKEEGRSINSMKEYCQLKMYQMKLSKWILLTIDIRGKNQIFDFLCLDSDWKYEKTKEVELEIFKNNRIQQFLSVNKKPKPNDLCPCNNGKKFKKCCAYKLR